MEAQNGSESALHGGPSWSSSHRHDTSNMPHWLPAWNAHAAPCGGGLAGSGGAGPGYGGAHNSGGRAAIDGLVEEGGPGPGYYGGEDQPLGDGAEVDLLVKPPGNKPRRASCGG